MVLPKFSSRLAWLVFYLALALILTNNSLAYLDPDFGWHLRVGENIAREGAVPHAQIYLWSLGNKTWVDHEWLANLTTFKLWEFGGYTAVTLFFVLLPLIGFIILNRYLFTNYLKTKSQRLVFASLELLALTACLPHFGVRMQEITFLFTIILFIIIDYCRLKQNLKVAYFIPPLLFLWSCLHGGFLFGLAIILGWLIYEGILKLSPLIKNFFHEQALDNKNLLKLFIIIFLAFLLTLVTPYGKELYSFLGDYGINRYYLSHIQEWRSPYSLSFLYSQIFYTQVIIVLALSALVYLKKKLALWQAVLVLALLILASRSVRHFPLWAAGSLLFLAPQAIKSHLADIKLAYGKIIIRLAIACLILASIALGLKINFINQPFASYCQKYPCGAVQFLKNNPEYKDLKMFNDYDWGGYLVGVWPDKKLFIDGRLPQYNFKGHSLLEEYYSFFNDQEVKNKLNEYDIKLVLLKTKDQALKLDWFEQLITGEKLVENKNPVSEYLKISPDWKIVYSDDVATVYIKQ